MLENREEPGDTSKAEPFCKITGKGNRLNSGGIGINGFNEPISLNSFQRNEIKKVLHKEKAVATLKWENDTYSTYSAITSIGIIYFNIPINESIDFTEEEPAKLLIHWLYSIDSSTPQAKDKNSAILWNNFHPLTVLQETCIRLGIPKSGNPELDALILESERKWIAVEAMGGLLTKYQGQMVGQQGICESAIVYSDELLKQLGYEYN